MRSYQEVTSQNILLANLTRNIPEESSSDEEAVEIMAAELVKGKLYAYSALKPSKIKEIIKSKVKEGYFLDITKVEQIFEFLLKDKQIKLPDGHKVRTTEELKGKQFCKWHNVFTHQTNNCLNFRNVFEKAIKDGRLRFDESTLKLKTETDPFPKSRVSMVSLSQ